MTRRTKAEPVNSLLGQLFRAHPWHGVPIGAGAPERVTCFIEIVPTDRVKYEIDKRTGYLKVDRPQLYSNICPAPYGLIPQTFCGPQVAALTMERTGRTGIQGDGDPLDVCVLTQSAITHPDILIQARPVGGLRMLDGNEADDKIIAVLHNDGLYGSWQDLTEIPPAVVNRLVHYFETYKLAPGAIEKPIVITHVFGREEAHDLIRRAQADYHDQFGYLEKALSAALENRAEFRTE
jgi:inorganic pyrophosphatase